MAVNEEIPTKNGGKANTLELQAANEILSRKWKTCVKRERWSFINETNGNAENVKCKQWRCSWIIHDEKRDDWQTNTLSLQQARVS